jgi:hypothetical protein
LEGFDCKFDVLLESGKIFIIMIEFSKTKMEFFRLMQFLELLCLWQKMSNEFLNCQTFSRNGKTDYIFSPCIQIIFLIYQHFETATTITPATTSTTITATSTITIADYKN